MTRTCPECGRVFDLTNAVDAEEAAYGHDCEAPARPAPVTHEHAMAVDTELARLWGEEQAVRLTLDRDALYLQHAVGDEVPNASWGFKYNDRRRFRTTDAEAESRAREQHAAGTLRLSVRSAVESVLKTIDVRRAKLAALRAEQEPLQAEYRADPWPRFFFVVSSAHGHIHSSMSCSTCRPTTGFAWQPQLSGLTEADAVAALGPKLCSVCYPSAPVEWLGTGKGA